MTATDYTVQTQELNLKVSEFGQLFSLNAANELMRRHLNTLQDMPDSEKDTVDAINAYMFMMLDSGYSQSYKRDTVIAAKKGIQWKMRQAWEGIRSYYRLQMKVLVTGTTPKCQRSQTGLEKLLLMSLLIQNQL